MSYFDPVRPNSILEEGMDYLHNILPGTIVKHAYHDSDTRFMVFTSRTRQKSLLRLDTFSEVAITRFLLSETPFKKMSATLTLHGN